MARGGHSRCGCPISIVNEGTNSEHSPSPKLHLLKSLFIRYRIMFKICTFTH